jgi:ATP-binding cassette subfamily D (ALD) long-chain fatty acid import protein
MVVLHTIFLVLRTVLSVAVARLDGKIVRALVSADSKGFMKGLGLWYLLAIPSTYTNSMLRHLQSKLSLRLRTRLSRYTHDLYLASAPLIRYYRVGSEGGLEGVDQYITSDIAAFCDSLSALYGNVMKPSLDLIIFTAQLSRSLGVSGSVLLFANYLATAAILRAVTPAFGRLAAVEARLEGEYRAGVARVGRESEEVAFYGGGGREKDILWRAYLRLMKHVNSIYKIRIAYEWTEDYVIKYLWSAAGYCLISIPVLVTGRRRSVGIQADASDVKKGSIDDAVASRTEDYISNRRLLISLADAGGRLMYAYKDLLELAGLTTRIYTLLSTLHNLQSMPDFIESKDRFMGEGLKMSEAEVRLQGVAVTIPGTRSWGSELEDDEAIEGTSAAGREGGMLVRPLNLRIRKGEHLMITGPNGVGKTAIARVLAGLWAGEGGEIHRPPRGVKGVFVIPQRPYMVVGSLRDQVIYPHSYPEFIASGRTDADLMKILEAVHLAYLPEREGGWTTRKEWKDVLSGGEKQRMGMARLFYHHPEFAVLDECTSAVSTDVEGLMYQYAKDMGITLITISHRPSLIKYHTRLLTLIGDDAGNWTETKVGTDEERMGLDREIANLEQKLSEVEGWEKRVREIAAELGVASKF